jgi:hypothetical protein
LERFRTEADTEFPRLLVGLSLRLLFTTGLAVAAERTVSAGAAVGASKHNGFQWSSPWLFLYNCISASSKALCGLQTSAKF